MNKKQPIKVVEISGKDPKALSRGLDVLSALLAEFLMSKQQSDAEKSMESDKKKKECGD